MARKSHAASLRASLLATSLAFAVPAQAADMTVTLDAGSGFVIEDNTGTIERLRVDEATGNISRNGALFMHTTGSSSTFVGEAAGNTSTTGSSNSAFGSLALSSNDSGSANSAFGFYALLSNTTGNANSAFGEHALRFNTTGSDNSAFGLHALRSNTTSDSNSAFGMRALFSNTTGHSNSAFGRYALRNNLSGSENAAFGYSALRDNQTGFHNAAFGHNALRAGNGNRNSAFGQAALRNNTASYNSAFGNGALYRNEGGTFNSAFGQAALRNNVSGSDNSAFGLGALYANSTGYGNTAFGREALRNATGNHNTAIGDRAGFNLTSGNFNIYIRARGTGTESGKIRIGRDNSGYGFSEQTFIYGIRSNIAGGGVVVRVSSDEELGIIASSIRFKEAVRDMGETSELLMKLRPVTFRYREAVANGEAIDQYGLIAEEVAKVAPELVGFDAEGDPRSVRYDILPSLLLNQDQKQQRTIEEQQQVIKALTGRLDSIEQLLAARSKR